MAGLIIIVVVLKTSVAEKHALVIWLQTGDTKSRVPWCHVHHNLGIHFGQGSLILHKMSALKFLMGVWLHGTVAGLIIIVVVLMTFAAREMCLCSLARNCAVKK